MCLFLLKVKLFWKFVPTLSIKYWTFSYFFGLYFTYENTKKHFIQCKMYCSQWDKVSFPIHIVTLKIFIKNKFPIQNIANVRLNVSFLRFETGKSNCQFSKKECGDYLHILWTIPEKTQRMRTWNFLGYWRRAYGNSRDQVKMSGIFT